MSLECICIGDGWVLEEGALGKQGKPQGAWVDMIKCSDVLTSDRMKLSCVRKMVKEKRKKGDVR